MEKTRLLINGYGRIGRVFHRVIMDDPLFEVVGICSRADAQSHAHLLKYDSTYATLDKKIESGKDFIKVDGKKIKVFIDKDPGEIDFEKEGVDILAECTGKFKDRESCLKQIKAGAKKVVISAPGKDEDISIVYGVNETDYNPQKHHIISNASCTTNCLAVVVKVLQEKFGIEHGHMTTIHALTRSQNLLDGSHSKDLRIARAAIDSFMPYKTGASKAIGIIFPELDGKLTGISVRIPFNTVSLVDLVVELKRKTTAEELNKEFDLASKSNLKGMLGITMEPLVSIDFKGDSRSAVVDGLSTRVINDSLAKVMAWYDNEWGYTERFADLIRLVSKSL